MKKITTILAVAALFAGTTSCKKDYSCECTDSGVTYTYTITDAKKSAAAAVCEGKGYDKIEFGGVASTSSSNCELK